MSDVFLQTFDDESNAVRTDALRKDFGSTTALDGVSLSVPERAVYLLVGPNGAGKTTLLRVLLDELRATAGTTRVLGHDTDQHADWARAAIGYIPEGGLPPYHGLRVAELLKFHAAYYAGWDTFYAGRLASVLGVPLESRIGALSKGEARRAQIVMALAHRPPLLLLDEPTDGLDPVIRDRFFGLLAAHLSENDTTVLLSSHLVYESELLASHLGVLAQGRLCAQLDRATLDAKLRRYAGRMQAEASLDPALLPHVLDSHSFAGGTEWVIWGDESEVRARLAGSDVELLEARRLSLEESARALMQRQEVQAS